ncbi:MAG TPA: hypothetical protein VH724_11000 [Candidatus Angelobacter sp.]|nr:hypothetical protein [Candidatus Angelobacter sp.]
MNGMCSCFTDILFGRGNSITTFRGFAETHGFAAALTYSAFMDQFFKSVARLGDAISICAFRGIKEVALRLTGPITRVASVLAPSANVRGPFPMGMQVSDCLFSQRFSPSSASFRVFLWTAWQVFSKSLEGFKTLSPINTLPPQWQEMRNKLEAFSLFEHVDLELDLGAFAELPLPALVQKARMLGPYRCVWATEGVGHYHADSHLSRGKSVNSIWNKQDAQNLPTASFVPLHAGIGLALAEQLLADVHGLNNAEFGTRIIEFVQSCQSAFQREYVEIIYEALGLATRNLYPHLTAKMHLCLAQANRELPEYFWHGVGRALYFAPSSFLPGHSTPWPGLELCLKEPPNQACRRNAVAGFAWALTLVNIRQPRIMMEFLACHGENLHEHEAIVNGICSALVIWSECCSNTNDLNSMNQHQGDRRGSETKLWAQYVGEACRSALLYCSANTGKEHLGQLFRYQQGSTGFAAANHPIPSNDKLLRLKSG